MSGIALPDDPIAVALAEGASALWKEWERVRAGEVSGTGEKSLWVENQPIMLIWRSNTERLAARIVSSGHVERNWIGNTGSPNQSFRIGITDNEGRAIVPVNFESGALNVRRTLAGSQLQWTLHAALIRPEAEFAQSDMRANLLLAGLVVVMLIALAGTYAVTRAVNRELEIARLQSDFVAAVSHEFRSPLTTMQQASELLASGRVPTEERRAGYYDLIGRETSRLRRLVEDLLDFGRMEAGAQVYRRQPLHIREIVTQVVSDFQAQIENCGYIIVFDPGDVNAIVDADQEAFRRVCWNLLDNAVKYSPDCKTVWMALMWEGRYISIRVPRSTKNIYSRKD